MVFGSTQQTPEGPHVLEATVLVHGRAVGHAGYAETRFRIVSEEFFFNLRLSRQRLSLSTFAEPGILKARREFSDYVALSARVHMQSAAADDSGVIGKCTDGW